jgi:predicted kinase
MTQHPTANKPTLILLIGIPGSGKSSFVNQLLAKNPQIQLISTDMIRGEIFGNPENQGCWLLVWQEVQRKFELVASRNQTAIYDATNATQYSRHQVIEIAHKAGFMKIVGIWLRTPIWLCLARNKRRQRCVPESIIFQMYAQLQSIPPSTTEGFDDLVEMFGNFSGNDGQKPHLDWAQSLLI